MKRFAFPSLCVCVIGLLSAATAFGQTTITTNPIRYTDTAGNTHPMHGIVVELYDQDDITADDLLGTTTTNVGGLATVTTNTDDGVLNFEFEVYSQVYARVPGVASVRNTFGSADYSVRNPTTGFTPVTIGSSTIGVNPSLTVDNSTFIGASMTMLMPAHFMHDYYRDNHGANWPEIPIVYNNDNNGDAGDVGTNYTGDRVNIELQVWASSDVVMHEFGHHLAENFNLDSDTNWGDSHSFGRDNIGALDGGRDYGRTKGSHLAWGEAVATFVGLMAIDDGNYAGFVSGALPGRDTDNVAHTLETLASTANASDITIAVSAESNAPATGAKAPGIGTGEGDELSVLRVLWDFYDSTGENYGGGLTDNVDLTAANMWAAMTGSDTLHDFWETAAGTIAADPTLIGLPAGAKKAQVLTTLGETLEAYNVSADPVTSGMINDTTPELRFDELNNNNSHEYAFVLFDDEWDLVGSNVVSNPNAEQNVGLGFQTWDAMPELTVGEDYYFAVLNAAAINTNTTGLGIADWEDWYWSSANLITIVPEPSALAVLCVGAASVAYRRRR